MLGLLALYVGAPLLLGAIIEVIQYFFVDNRQLKLADRIADTTSYAVISASALMVAAGFDFRIALPLFATYLVARYLNKHALPDFPTILHDFSHAGFGAGLVLLYLAVRARLGA